MNDSFIENKYFSPTCVVVTLESIRTFLLETSNGIDPWEDGNSDNPFMNEY